MTKNDETERFELAYIAAHELSLPDLCGRFHRDASGEYGYPLVRAAWRLWQAAWQQSADDAQDAARYRWLRDATSWPYITNPPVAWLHGEAADAAIDRARGC